MRSGINKSLSSVPIPTAQWRRWVYCVLLAIYPSYLMQHQTITWFQSCKANTMPPNYLCTGLLLPKITILFDECYADAITNVVSIHSSLARVFGSHAIFVRSCHIFSVKKGCSEWNPTNWCMVWYVNERRYEFTTPPRLHCTITTFLSKTHKDNVNTWRVTLNTKQAVLDSRRYGNHKSLCEETCSDE